MMAIVVVPSFAITGYLLSVYAAERTDRVEKDAHARVKSIALVIDGVTNGMVSSLKALSTSPSLSAATISDFDQQLKETFANLDIDVVVRDSTLAGINRLNGVAPPPVRDADLPAARSALTSTDPQFSSFDENVRDGKPGVSIWLGARTPTGDPIVFQIRLTSKFLATQLMGGNVDDTWAANISDRNRRIIAQSRDSAKYLGRSRTAETIEKATTLGPTGVIKTTNMYGVKTMNAYTHASVSGWWISLVAPLHTINQVANQTWNYFVALGLGATLLSVGVASGLARSVTTSVRSAAENARKLVIGEQPEPFTTPVREVADLTETLTATVEELASGKIALEASDKRLRMALDASGMGIWEWDCDTDAIVWDEAQKRILGVNDETPEPNGREFVQRIYPDDRSDFENAVRGLTLDGPKLDREYRVFRYDGALRWVAVRASLVQGPAKDKRIVGVMYDITDDKTRTDQTGTLLREISHRSKNMLALILAMARLTARGASDVTTHLREFSLRIAGLSASQDLIVDSNWVGVKLSDLVIAEAKAIAHDRSTRVHVSGPVIRVTPEAAQTLGMAFAELTLNAMEHGALATANGVVDVSWSVSDSDDLTVTWIESGGPKAASKPVRGYGLSVVENLAGRSLSAASSVVFAEDGVRWTLHCPLRNVTALGNQLPSV